VTWNGLHVLQACVAALAQQTLPHELIIVDNASQDDTRSWLRQHAPEAKVLALPHNIGFAAGNNVGLRAAQGDYLVLLNNDTIPSPDFLERLVSPLHQSPQIGSVAGVLTFAHMPTIIASAGIIVGRDGLHQDLWALSSLDTLPQEPVEIFGASGGAVCYTRAALADVGLFDERYFMYLEDADLAWRMRLRGWSCVVAPGACVRHIYSASSGQGSPFKQRLLARNRVHLLIRCFPSALLEEHWAEIVRYDILAIGYGMLRRQPAIISGRLAALRRLPFLLAERRTIQARREVAVEELARWLEPAISIREMLQQQRHLTAVLQNRDIANN